MRTFHERRRTYTGALTSLAAKENNDLSRSLIQVRRDAASVFRYVRARKLPWRFGERWAVDFSGANFVDTLRTRKNCGKWRCRQRNDEE